MPIKPEKKKIIKCVVLTEELDAKVKKIATLNNLSQSRAIRIILEDYFNETP